MKAEYIKPSKKQSDSLRKSNIRTIFDTIKQSSLKPSALKSSIKQPILKITSNILDIEKVKKNDQETNKPKKNITIKIEEKPKEKIDEKKEEKKTEEKKETPESKLVNHIQKTQITLIPQTVNEIHIKHPLTIDEPTKLKKIDEEKDIICKYCSKNANYKCSLCQKYFQCEKDSHKLEWESHKKKDCPVIAKLKRIKIYNNLLFYEPLWNEKRKEIIEHLRKKDYSKAIEKTYLLIQENYNTLIIYESEEKILPFYDLKEIINNKDHEKFVHTYLYYEDYFCNLLLLINSFYLFKSKDQVWRLLNRLVREMESYYFFEVTNLIIQKNIEAIKTGKNQDKDDKIDYGEVYLRILKILVTIAKYGNILGEFSFYEKYLLEYISKILKVYSNDLEDKYIDLNTYLLLGNLYVEYGFLHKGFILYETIINSNSSNYKEDSKLNNVLLCANYNLGLINFVIDKYEMARHHLATALKIKKEYLREKNDLQISQIYETLSEMDIEYKNYSGALENLQKAIESRQLSNTSDNDFRLKVQQLGDYIEQNNTDTKGELNNMQYGLGKIVEESENEKLVNDMINDTPINIDNKPDIQELEKFFLFMTKLTSEQIKILNEAQPRPGRCKNGNDFEESKRFPIVFSKKFKNSLTHSQRLALCNLKMTSLTRLNVLKDHSKKISIKNLNYNALNLVPPENNLNAIRNLYVTKTILKNWETKDEDNKIINQKINESENESEDDKENEVSKKAESNKNNNKLKEVKEEKKENLEVTSDLESIEEDDKIDINYDSLMNCIKKYCRQTAPEKEKYIDNKFMFLLCRNSGMTKEELKTVEKNPELIKLLIETYVDVNKEDKKEKFIDQEVKDIDDMKIINDFFQDEESISSDNIPKPPPLALYQNYLSNQKKEEEEKKEEKDENNGKEEKEEKKDDNGEKEE